MARSKPKLITFGISHYCEKARWALDRHGIDYEEVGWPPGVHIMLSKRHGARATTLPIVLDGEQAIQDSSTIIDWADGHAESGTRSLTVPGCREIERRADDAIGVNVRRLFYAETLPSVPECVKPDLFRNASAQHRMLGDVMWPITRRVMMRKYDITSSAAAESRAKLEDELDWLDGELADGRPYLVGDRFSRADICVASLLALFSGTEQIPYFHNFPTPKALIDILALWNERPVMKWVRKIYRTERFTNAAGRRSLAKLGGQVSLEAV